MEVRAPVSQTPDAVAKRRIERFNSRVEDPATRVEMAARIEIEAPLQAYGFPYSPEQKAVIKNYARDVGKKAREEYEAARQTNPLLRLDQALERASAQVATESGETSRLFRDLRGLREGIRIDQTSEHDLLESKIAKLSADGQEVDRNTVAAQDVSDEQRLTMYVGLNGFATYGNDVRATAALDRILREIGVGNMQSVADLQKLPNWSAFQANRSANRFNLATQIPGISINIHGGLNSEGLGFTFTYGPEAQLAEKVGPKLPPLEQNE